jgi:hypothetical protein
MTEEFYFLNSFILCLYELCKNFRIIVRICVTDSNLINSLDFLEYFSLVNSADDTHELCQLFQN